VAKLAERVLGRANVTAMADTTSTPTLRRGTNY